MPNKLKSCPFCGEIPQRNKFNSNQIMHACRVLDLEIRATEEAWNRMNDK